MTGRILVVEDHEDNRRILRDLLTSVGFQLIEAETGPDGVQMAKVHQPDLILMDLQLPGIDGYEAARQIKAESSLKLRADNRRHILCFEWRRRAGLRGRLQRLYLQAV